MTEQFANLAASTLSAAITSTSATSLSVTSASTFPTSGNFRIIIDSEIMLVTAVSGTTFTVTRGAESSTAATHSNGAAVTHILTAAVMQNITSSLIATPIIDANIASAATWNAKQNALSGTGFVKISGTSISYDNSTYLTTSSASSTYVPQTTTVNGHALSGNVTVSATDITTGTLPSAQLPTASASVLGGVKVDGTSITIASGVISAPGGGSGTVTTMSIVSANGFTGTVANATTTPAVTLTTSITGMLKGNGTAISAATSGSDYSAGTSALTTGIVKSTTSTGALTIAVAADFPTLNQNTTGSAATLTTARTINGTSFDGSANITVTAAASTLTGTTLNSTVVSSSLTSVGTLTGLNVSGTANLANLTASTALALDASKNIVSVTNTGSGNNVLATSPTLVTPALGTPASGVLTNCTGTASGLTAGNVTTNANLTGPVTSSGNATTLVTSLHFSAGSTTAVGNQTFYAVTKAAFGGTINSILGAQTTSGTITLAVKINGTNVTGLSSISVTSTAADSTASGANTFSAGDVITWVTSSASSDLGLAFSMKITRA